MELKDILQGIALVVLGMLLATVFLKLSSTSTQPPSYSPAPSSPPINFGIVFTILGVVAVGVLLYVIYQRIRPVLTTVASSPTSSTPISPSSQYRFMFFYSTWCPWSKKARPQWDAFRSDMDTHPATFGGKRVVLEEIDGDAQSDIRKQYGVSAYPTFKLVTPEGTQDMTTVPTVDGMRDFLVRALGAEEHVQLAPRSG